MGGVVFVKSSGWMVAFGGGFWRKDGGIFRDVIVVRFDGDDGWREGRIN
jgi:hypothetical protein